MCPRAALSLPPSLSFAAGAIRGSLGLRLSSRSCPAQAPTGCAPPSWWCSPSTYVPGRTPPDIGGPVMYLCLDRTRATDAALEATVNWVGPAIIVTTQTDTVFRSIGERAEDGEVMVFDPLNVSGRANASWTPLQVAHTSAGADYVVDLLRPAQLAGGHNHAAASPTSAGSPRTPTRPCTMSRTGQATGPARHVVRAISVWA